MPIYRETLQLGGQGESYDPMKIFLFDHCDAFEDEKKHKQMICSETCITLGTRSLPSADEEYSKKLFKNGQIFSGYHVKTINGPYDYCYKIWTDRRLPVGVLNLVNVDLIYILAITKLIKPTYVTI